MKLNFQLQKTLFFFSISFISDSKRITIYLFRFKSEAVFELEENQFLENSDKFISDKKRIILKSIKNKLAGRTRQNYLSLSAYYFSIRQREWFMTKYGIR